MNASDPRCSDVMKLRDRSWQCREDLVLRKLRGLVFALIALASCRNGVETPSRDAAPEASAAPTVARTCNASSATCASDEFCSFDPRLCGKGKRPGVCRP